MPGAGRGGGCKLVLAGGYDARLAENREYFQELEGLVDELGLEGQVSVLAAGCQPCPSASEGSPEEGQCVEGQHSKLVCCGTDTF